MKKLIATIAICALASSAMADLTGFQWVGGRIFDETGAQVTAGGVIHTTTVDLSAYVVGGQISYSDIPASFYATTALGYAPRFLGGTYSTVTINGVNEIEGQVLPVVYGIVDLNGGAIEVGDFIGLTAGFYTVDLQPTPDPPAIPQLFNAGDITVFQIPEPATGGLMVLVSGGIFFTRRRLVI